jgi:hypothetical protein
MLFDRGIFRVLNMNFKLIIVILSIICIFSCTPDKSSSQNKNNLSISFEKPAFEIIRAYDIKSTDINLPILPTQAEFTHKGLVIFDKADNAVKLYSFHGNQMVFNKVEFKTLDKETVHCLEVKNNTIILCSDSCIYRKKKNSNVEKYTNIYGLSSITSMTGCSDILTYNSGNFPKVDPNSLVIQLSEDLTVVNEYGQNSFKNTWHLKNISNCRIASDRSSMVVSCEKSSKILFFDLERGKQKTISVESKALNARQRFNRENSRKFCVTWYDIAILEDFIFMVSPDFGSNYLIIYDLKSNVESIKKIATDSNSSVISVSAQRINEDIFLAFIIRSSGTYKLQVVKF